jgi:hypothetical protein
MTALKKAMLLVASVMSGGVGTSVHAQSMEVYGSAGTDGAGLGAGFGVGRFNARAELDGFHLSRNFSSGNLHYDASLTVIHGGIFEDFFPVPSLFPVRITGGVLLGGDNISGTATSNSGTYTINGVTVNANGEAIRAKLTYPKVRPYIGIGFGHSPVGRGFSVAFDAGVAYGKPGVTFDVPSDIASAAGEANVDAEKAQLESKANSLRFSPVAKVALTYRF